MACVLGCCGVAVEPTITAVTSPRMMADVDEYTNICAVPMQLQAPFWAGVMHCAFCLLITAWPEAPRIPPHVGHHPCHLEEESLLGAFKTPCLVPTVEQLTDAIAEKAWTAFRAWSCTDGRELWIRNSLTEWRRHSRHGLRPLRPAVCR